MPRKLVSRLMPHPKSIAYMRNWGWLGRKLFATDLWHLNRRTVALAFLNGLFWACMPMPLQMVAAAFFALILRCNVPISIGLVWLTNPVTMLPYYLAAYQLGAFILGTDGVSFPEDVSIAWAQEQTNLIWWPLLTGSLVFGIVLSLVGYCMIRIWWAWKIRINWIRRKTKGSNDTPIAHDAIQNTHQSEKQPGDHESQ
jgi:uncharacterized protein (DUF2062 family)